MKVHELITELLKYPAGVEVSTLNIFENTLNISSEQQEENSEERFNNRLKNFEIAYKVCDDGWNTRIETLANYLGVTERTIRNRVNEHEGFRVVNNVVERVFESDINIKDKEPVF